MIWLAVFVAAATSAGADGTSNCGRIAGGIKLPHQAIDTFSQYSYYVFADGVDCRIARSVGRAWGAATNIDGGAPLDATVLGYSCTRASYNQTKPAATCSQTGNTVILNDAPLVPTIVNFSSFAIKPSVISQGASNDLFKLRWDGWGGPTAHACGTGSFGVTDHYHRCRLALTASTIGRCRGIRVYTRLRLKNLDSGTTSTEILRCNAGQYV